MNYTKKIVCFLYITGTISMLHSENKQTLTYTQQRNKRTQKKKMPTLITPFITTQHGYSKNLL